MNVDPGTRFEGTMYTSVVEHCNSFQHLPERLPTEADTWEPRPMPTDWVPDADTPRIPIRQRRRRRQSHIPGEALR